MSVTTDPRMVIVDDTSADINYIGDSWFADVRGLDAIGFYGPPFLSTSHGTNANASLAFSFTGSSVTAFGTSPIRNASGKTYPRWSCYVDGIAIESSPATAYDVMTNNWPFCYSEFTHDGPHTITVNATVAGNHTFWFDSITYQPSRNLSLENKVIIVPGGDPAIQLGTGWDTYLSLGYWTQKQGALFGLNFYGTSISWYGHMPLGNESAESTTATWVIDDNPAQAFVLKGPGTNCSCPSYSQKLFETPVYPFRSHTLTVTYHGDSSKAPLFLGYLVIQNGTSTAPRPPSATHANSSKTPAIVGGTIGGVACVSIVVLLFLYYRRRRVRHKETGTTLQDELTYHVPEPQVALNAYDSESPSQLEAKGPTGYPEGPIYLLPPTSGPSSPMNNTLATATYPDWQHSRHPFVFNTAGPSGSVDDGGTPLPPAYTPL